MSSEADSIANNPSCWTWPEDVKARFRDLGGPEAARPEGFAETPEPEARPDADWYARKSAEAFGSLPDGACLGYRTAWIWPEQRVPAGPGSGDALRALWASLPDGPLDAAALADLEHVRGLFGDVGVG